MAQNRGKPVRFARVRGRVVPIYANHEARKADYRKTAKMGAGAGAVSIAGQALLNKSMKTKSKFGMALGGVAMAGGFGAALGIGVSNIVKGARDKKGRRGKTWFGHFVSQSLGGLAGQVGATAGIVGGVYLARKFRTKLPFRTPR